MNYLKELNAFHEWLDTNPMNSGAIVLWYTLMAVNNKTNWIDEFTVANMALQAKTGLSRQQLDRARTELINANRISYKKSGQANKAGKYSIVSFDTQNGHRTDTRRSQDGHEVTTLIKLNKTKLNETGVVDEKKKEVNTKTDFGSLYNIYLRYFTEDGKTDEFDTQEFGFLYDDYGGEWLLEALRESHRHRKYTLAYLNAILRDWKKAGVVRPKLNKTQESPQQQEDIEMVKPPDILGEE